MSRSCIRRVIVSCALIAAATGCGSDEPSASQPVVTEPTATAAIVADPTPTAAPLPPATAAVEATPTPNDTSLQTPVAVPTPPSHPWYECEFFDYALIGVDYRVTNIAADDPDGGLVAHVAPGIEAVVTEVLPDATGELRIAGCQQKPDSGSVWWLVETRGWVNASYLEAYSPFGSPDWIPGMTNPLPTEGLPDVIGLEAETLEQLRDAVRSQVAFEDFTMVELGNFLGVDARGGIARLDITNIGDDSVSGYRMELVIDFIKDESATDILGFRIASATGRAICSRGVTADGDLCV